MASSFCKPYLDSTVFFAHIKKEEIESVGGLERWKVAYRILKDAETGSYKAFTSVVTLAEVRRIKVKDEELDENELAAVRKLFAHEYINLIEVNREIGEKAQELGATFSITPIDAIHLATSIWWECDAFLSWDKRLTAHLGTSQIESVRLSEPYCGDFQMPLETQL